MPALEEIVRPQAELRRVIDGDTYDLLVNWKRRRDWRGATVARVRLRDYRARERGDKGPAKRGDPRVAGPVASAIAATVLAEAGSIHVEMQGTDSLGRDMCWVWIDGESLGEVLTEQRAVAPGRAEG